MKSITKLVSISYRNKKEKESALQQFKLIQSNPETTVKDIPNEGKITGWIASYRTATEECDIYLHTEGIARMIYNYLTL